MATVTITPSAAQDYQGSTELTTTNHWIGRPSGYAQACTVRYTFKPTKNLSKIVAKITGTLWGIVDGKFRYNLSTSSSFPTTWTAVTTEADGYLSITRSGALTANTTYYLFVTKETSGNYVYYAGCSAENVTITGTVTEYTISYNANGGTGAPSSQTKTHGTALTLSTTKPTKASTTATGFKVTFDGNGGTPSKTSATATNTTKYTFNKWNTKSDGSGTSYSSGGSYTADASATLYAQYTGSTTKGSVTTATATKSNGSASRTVTINANGGISAVTSRTSTASITYACSGWYTETSGGTKRAAAGGSYTPSASETVYAQWTATTGAYSAVTLPTTAQCSRDGYELLGFATSAAATAAAYAPGASYTPSKDITLYAVWAAQGLVYVDTGTGIEPRQMWVDNGSSWEQYAPYLDEESSWAILG